MWEMINEIGKWMGVGMLVASLAICFIAAFWHILIMLVEAFREEVKDLRNLRKERKELTAENGWHECKVEGGAIPLNGEWCVLRVEYTDGDYPPVYVTAAWEEGWTEDFLDRFEDGTYKITHWKRI